MVTPQISASFTSTLPGITPEDLISEAAHKIIHYHFNAMLRNEAGSYSGTDVEAVHDMRVAIRRMRSAFEVLNDVFKPKVINRYAKELRKLAKVLGRVRDTDVFIEKTLTYLESIPEDTRSRLDPLLEKWSGKHDVNHQHLTSYLDSERYKIFKLKIDRFLQTLGNGVRKSLISQMVPKTVSHLAPTIIYAQMATVRAFDPLIQGAAIETLHELRIEFKKLRYTIEFFKEVLGEESKSVIQEIKKIQDHLGDLNDADIACHQLHSFLDDWETQHRQADQQNTLESANYYNARKSERQNLLVTFSEVWANFENPEFRRNLALAISEL